MKVIYKYELSLDGSCNHISSFEDFKPLKVEMQRGNICLWALVNPGSPVKEHTIYIIPTGMPFDGNGLEYIETFMPDPYLVFHVFWEK